MPIQTATIVEVKGPRRRKIVPGKRPIEVHRLLTVGEVSARSGVAVSALHFYEAKGLIASRRSEGNQRRYHREVLRRVAVIKVAQRVRIPLAEIGRALSALPEGRPPERKSVVLGKGVAVPVNLGGRRNIQKKKKR